jgi:hypothetical protein
MVLLQVHDHVAQDRLFSKHMARRVRCALPEDFPDRVASDREIVALIQQFLQERRSVSFAVRQNVRPRIRRELA